MSDEQEPKAGEPGTSPDFLAQPGRGKGVRRLNRRPLFIVGGLVVLVVLAITYTFFQRQAAMRHVAQSPVSASSVADTAVPPVRPEDGDGPPQPTGDAQPTVPAVQTQPTASDTATAQAAMSPELKARLRFIQRIEEKRLSDAEKALGATADVSGFKVQKATDNTGSGMIGPNGQPMTAAQMAGLAGAADVLRHAGAGAAAAGGGQTVPPLNVGGGMGGLGGGMGGMGGQGGDPNGQDHKRAFLAQTPDTSTYLKHTRTPPISNTEIKAGTVIPGVMIGGINSDLPGTIVGQVRRNVYDSATGRYLLIPAGARLVGTYDSSVTMGQSRVLVGWKRIIYPDGSSVSLDFMPGTDQGGYAGFHDKVNNHLWKIFGNALLLSAFSAGVQLSQPQSTNGQNYNSSQIVAGALGQQLGEVGMTMAQRGMNIQPTLQIRPGYKFNIMVNKDIVLPVWNGRK